MLKKLLPFLFLASSLFADVPQELFVTERLETLTTSFDLETKDRRLGSVYRKIFSLSPEYQLKNLSGETIVKARMRFWSNGVVFDVKDTKGDLLGTIEERFDWLTPYLEIVTATGQKFGKGEFNFWRTQFSLKDPMDDHEIALFTRPFFRLYNGWKVEIKDLNAFKEDKIHPNLFLVLVGLQIDYRYWTYSSSRSYSVGNEENVVLKELREELANFKPLFKDVKATKEDFEFAYNLGNDRTDDFYQTAKELIQQLSSETLTLSQRKALFKLLDRNLN